MAQLSAIQIENPHNLWVVSGLSGRKYNLAGLAAAAFHLLIVILVAYGITFGVYPALVGPSS